MFSFFKKEKNSDQVNTIQSEVIKYIFEVIQSDHKIEKNEISTAVSVLEKKLDIKKDFSLKMFEDLIEKEHVNIDLSSICKSIKNSMIYSDRLKLIDCCWVVLLSDKDEDIFEISTIRKLSSLIGIEDQDFISIRNKVRDDVFSK